MAKTKKVNNIKITSVKNSNTLKKGVKTTVVKNKKNNQSNKKLEINNGINKGNKNVKDMPKKNTKPINNIGKPNILTKEEIAAQRKERNRKKYEKGQQKYRNNGNTRNNNNIKEKKKVIVDDEINEVAVKVEVNEEYQKAIITDDTIENEEIVLKKTTEIEADKSGEKIKKIERKEKRKTNRKTSGFTQTLTNIRELSVNTINDVREKTNDNTIPLGKTFIEKSKRSKRLIIEAMVYAVMLTIIDVLCILIFDYFNFLRLFDIKALNVIITILIALVFNFFVAFMVDYFVTNVWLTNKRKKKDGEQNGDNRTFREKYKKNFGVKEGE